MEICRNNPEKEIATDFLLYHRDRYSNSFDFILSHAQNVVTLKPRLIQSIFHHNERLSRTPHQRFTM